MSDVTPAATVGRVAVRLAGAPTNLGTWWELAAALTAAGEAGAAASALAALGRAGSELGHVALAVACARSLDAAGDPTAAAGLIDVVAADHGRASKRIDRSLRSAPPAPPPADPTLTRGSVGAPVELAEAVAVAASAVAAAAASARGRAPDTLAPTPLVSVLEVEEVRELCRAMELVPYRTGQVIVDVGEPATAVYWIARGSVQVTRGEHVLGELRPNQFFGEIALVSGTTRTARVAAAMDAVLLRIPAAKIEALAARQPRLGKVLATYARARLLATVMRTSELFSRLGERERDELLPLFDTELIEAGGIVFARGSQEHRLCVIASGRCEVRIGDEVLARLGVGDGIGEMSLLARGPATHDVVALERTVLLSLSREKFDEVAVDHPGLLAEVYKLLVQREAENQAIVHDASDLIV